ncbi:energy-coupling factor ABC transporter ATP-binding protein [Abyssisolibacter fermentans]|uniref:energy-coupling factor ABC transporter ATP-binding protein n=1 Tax=Abyssisolibacter fermentans TaxID=1766203 RepID=UPI00082A5005|nr:ABC transporter ATP-binding protein [Abyssisolibacter fermentans]
MQVFDRDRDTVEYVLEINNLSYKYSGQDRTIFDNVNLKVERGQTVGIIGLSGDGKSTLCYTMTGIIPHVYGGDIKGSIKIYGKRTDELRVSEIAQKVGIVFQDPDSQLFSPTVEDELAFGPENLCINREEIGDRIKMALEFVGMSDYRYHNPNNLSGGQKQLIAIASVLSMKPEIFIFDEIFSQIDKEGKKKLKDVIYGLKKENKTIIMVEHDFRNLDVCDKIVLLKDKQLHECCDKEYVSLVKLLNP